MTPEVASIALDCPAGEYELGSWRRSAACKAFEAKRKLGAEVALATGHKGDAVERVSALASKSRIYMSLCVAIASGLKSKRRKSRAQVRTFRRGHHFMQLNWAGRPDRGREVAMATLKKMMHAKPDGKTAAPSGQCDAILDNAAWAQLADVNFVIPQQPSRKPLRAAKHHLLFVAVMGFDHPIRKDHRARRKCRRDPLPRVQFAVSKKLDFQRLVRRHDKSARAHDARPNVWEGSPHGADHAKLVGHATSSRRPKR